MSGLFKGGGFKLLGVQLIVVIIIGLWSAVVSFIVLKILDVTIHIRVPLHEELLGADLVEHSVSGSFDKTSGEWYDVTGTLVTIIDMSSQETYATSIRQLEHLLSNYERLQSSRRRSFAFGFRRQPALYPRRIAFKNVTTGNESNENMDSMKEMRKHSNVYVGPYESTGNATVSTQTQEDTCVFASA